ncbi:MAG: glutamate--tRNA ligase [Spirochaetia bacterium]|jgi:glutamyl-tRNA synthetase|nr:glutamate--tRNA ligase [Spirochaetia bacterium]
MEVRVRYAPSPTGLQHIGGVRTALFNYFFAKSQGGKFILRVEDTDRERYSDDSLQDLYDTLEWLGIKWDEGPVVGGPYGPYIQSQRYAIYQKYAHWLIEQGQAYYCYCTPERLEEVRKEQIASKSPVQGYDRHCRNLTAEQRAMYEARGIKPVIRLKVPLDGKTTFHDVLMGDITRRNRDVSPDPILLKSDGYPTYHLANVIDDHLMGITHIMRAQEWIPSGPLHVLLYKAFGWEPPVYCHLPMVMGKDGQKLSKRHGSTSVRDFRQAGYLPEALLNYVSLVGWSYDGQREFFSREDLEKLFDIAKINKAPGVFDYKKLDWFNGQYIRECDDERLRLLLIPFLAKAGFINDPPTEAEDKKIQQMLPSVKVRMKVLSDVVELTRFFFTDVPLAATELFIAKKMDLKSSLEALEADYRIIKEGFASGRPFSESEAAINEMAKEKGLKANGVFTPLRVALASSNVTLPMQDMIALLGKDRTCERIERAIEKLKSEVR